MSSNAVSMSAVSSTSPFFSSAFKRQQGPDGKYTYNFVSLYTQQEGSSSWNEKAPFSVLGETVYSDPNWANTADLNTVFEKLPEETRNPTLLKSIFEKWIVDCSGAFTKPPTITQCLANTTSIWDSNVPTASVLDDEEKENWILQWVPTRIHVAMPNFYVYWAPRYKVPDSKIPELTDFEGGDKIAEFDETPTVQNPEKTYTIVPSARQGDWLQEIPELQVPLSDGPALRLSGDEEDPTMIKFRRRLHEARMKAKLARYKAERLAQRFEERYGFYPSENEDEAETEADVSGMD